jgi:hypothetical protein
LFRLLFVNERQSGQAFFQLEGVEEDAVLVVVPIFVDLLVPYHAAVSGRDVHHLDPVGVADKVVRQHDGTLQARVCPFRSVGMGYVEPSHADGMDLISLLGNKALDDLAVVVTEYGGHGGGEKPSGRRVCGYLLPIASGGRQISMVMSKTNGGCGGETVGLVATRRLTVSPAACVSGRPNTWVGRQR